MIRLVLSFSISSAVLVLGLYTAYVQSQNFARAAELDRLQRSSEWHLRRTSELREELEHLEFELAILQNAEHESTDDRGRHRARH